MTQKEMIDLKEYLKLHYKDYDDGVFLSGKTGYWSNLSEKKNKEFHKILEKMIAKLLSNLLCHNLKK